MVAGCALVPLSNAIDKPAWSMRDLLDFYDFQEQVKHLHLVTSCVRPSQIHQESHAVCERVKWRRHGHVLVLVIPCSCRR